MTSEPPTDERASTGGDSGGGADESTAEEILERRTGGGDGAVSAIDDVLATRTGPENSTVTHVVRVVLGGLIGLVAGGLLALVLLRWSAPADPFAPNPSAPLAYALWVIAVLGGAGAGLVRGKERSTASFLSVLSYVVAAALGAFLMGVLLHGMIPYDSQWARSLAGKAEAVIILLGVVAGVKLWSDIYERFVRPRRASLPDSPSVVENRISRRSVLSGTVVTVLGLQGMGRLSNQKAAQREHSITESENLEFQNLSYGVTDTGDAYEIAGEIVNVSDDDVVSIRVSADFYNIRGRKMMSSSTGVAWLGPDQHESFSLSLDNEGMISGDPEEVHWFELKLEENYQTL